MQYTLTLVVSLVVIMSILKLMIIGGYRPSDTFHSVVGSTIILHGIGIAVFTIVWIWG
jgi:hypothetical protein